MIYLVLIWIHPGQTEVLRAYEQQAVAIMGAHGGTLERVFQPHIAGEPQGAPDEIHLLRFADGQGFASFRADPALAAAAPLREAAVRAVQLLPLREIAVEQYLREG